MILILSIELLLNYLLLNLNIFGIGTKQLFSLMDNDQGQVYI